MKYPRDLRYLLACIAVLHGACWALWIDGNPYLSALGAVSSLFAILYILISFRLSQEERRAKEVEWALESVFAVCRSCKGTGKLGAQVHIGVKGGGSHSFKLLPPCPNCDGNGHLQVLAR